jgi:hypothetical protein
MEAGAGEHVIELSRDVADGPEPLAALARECYPDMAVSVEEHGSVWRIRLASLTRFAAAYDGELGAVLAEMGTNFDEVMAWHRAESVGRAIWLEAMNQSWALVGWSRWLERGGAARPLIVHIDAHDDLGVPSLVCDPEPGRFVALMDDETIDLERSHTVERAVECGLIGLGSFITPLLRALPADIVHLAPPVSGDATGDGEPRPAERFTVEGAPWWADPDVARLRLRHDDDGACSYAQIADPAAIAAAARPGQPVLVDIDLNYFEMVPDRRRAPATASASVTEIVAGLQPLAPAIAAVTIAYSPGFCPARRWPRLLGPLRAGLRPILDRGVTTGAT